MTKTKNFKIIGHVHTDFDTKFGLPRQSGLIPELMGCIVFEKEFRSHEALRGLEEFDYLWIIWEFSEARRDEYSPTVRPPKLGGNERIGVFATRSPFRPNPIGLSVVKIEKIDYEAKDGPVIWVSGIDMMNNTPVLDIKPYIAYADSKPMAMEGFTKRTDKKLLSVVMSADIKKALSEKGIVNEKMAGLEKALALDPRPSYKEDSERIYGFLYAGVDIRFFVEDGVLTVVDIK